MEAPKTNNTLEKPKTIADAQNERTEKYADLDFDYRTKMDQLKDVLNAAEHSGNSDEIKQAHADIADFSQNTEKYFREELVSQGINPETEAYDKKVEAFKNINFEYQTAVAQSKINRREELLLKENKRLQGKNKLETLKNNIKLPNNVAPTVAELKKNQNIKISGKDVKRNIAEIEEQIRLENKKISNIEKAKFEYSIRNKNSAQKLFARGGNKMMKLKEHFTSPEKLKQLKKRLTRSALIGLGAGAITVGTGGAAALAAAGGTLGLGLTRSLGGFLGTEAAKGAIGATTKDSRMDLAKLKEQRKYQEITEEEYKLKRDALLEGRGKKLRNKNKFKNVVIGASALAGSLSAGGIIESATGGQFTDPFKRFGQRMINLPGNLKNVSGRLVEGVQGWFANDVDAIEKFDNTKLRTIPENVPIQSQGMTDMFDTPDISIEDVEIDRIEKELSAKIDSLNEVTNESLPKVETISGDIFINKGEGITHAFLRQLNADTAMGQSLRDYLDISGKATGADAFEAAKKLGYIGQNDEVRVNFGKGAGYELKINEEGKLISNEYFGGSVDAEGNYVGEKVVKHETHFDGDTFEGRGIEDRSTNENYEYRQGRGVFETNQQEAILTPAPEAVLEPLEPYQPENILTPADPPISQYQPEDILTTTSETGDLESTGEITFEDIPDEQEGIQKKKFTYDPTGKKPGQIRDDLQRAYKNGEITKSEQRILRRKFLRNGRTWGGKNKVGLGAGLLALFGFADVIENGKIDGFGGNGSSGPGNQTPNGGYNRGSGGGHNPGSSPKGG